MIFMWTDDHALGRANCPRKQLRSSTDTVSPMYPDRDRWLEVYLAEDSDLQNRLDEAASILLDALQKTN